MSALTQSGRPELLKPPVAAGSYRPEAAAIFDSRWSAHLILYAGAGRDLLEECLSRPSEYIRFAYGLLAAPERH